MTRLEQEFYARRSDEVARELLGRTIVYERGGKRIRARITEIAAYEGAEKTTSKGASYSPGLLSISTKFGTRLLDIATGRAGKPSCVTLRGAEVQLEDRVIKADGPGAVTKALGISKADKEHFDATCICGDTMWIEGDAINPEKIRELKGNSPNCKGIYRI